MTPRADKSKKQATRTTETAATEPPRPSPAAAGEGPPLTIPDDAPMLNGGLSAYAMWVEVFASRDNPPLPPGAVRGRIGS